MSPDISDNLDKFLGKDLRRYSDTKLLQSSDSDILNSAIFNVPLHNTKTRLAGGGGSASGGACYSDGNGSGGGIIGDDEFRQQRQPLFQQKPKRSSPARRSSNNITTNHQHSHHHHHHETSSLVQNMLGGGAPQITDIIFENSAQQYDPLDLNIQEILDTDNTMIKHQQQQQENNNKKKSHHSLHTVDSITAGGDASEHDENFDKSRLFFKSLPNLSNSCESLIKK